MRNARGLKPFDLALIETAGELVAWPRYLATEALLVMGLREAVAGGGRVPIWNWWESCAEVSYLLIWRSKLPSVLCP